jgi:S-adenosylmethionine-diacylgycerolhomoserine-N-methlytransferase
VSTHIVTLLTDLKTLYHLAVKPVRGNTHAERLESFYAGQAAQYDSFRRRLLPGRKELTQALGQTRDAVWVDMGGGTGANLEYLGERAAALKRFYVVDLSPSLLVLARQRIAERGLANVEAVEADATTFAPGEGQVDVVTFSYSLTMIPNWIAAVDHAWSLLRPGGRIGIVDFYVSRKHPPNGNERHGWLTRAFWPLWFARDNVFLSPDHLPNAQSRFEQLVCEERRTRIPYLPLSRVPYYLFVGRKPPN